MSPVILVTGGGSGIGRATILRFAAEGYKCAIADINEESAEATAAMVKNLIPEVKTLALKVDVTKSEDVQRMVTLTVEEFSRIDVAVNCAGVICPSSQKLLHEVSEEDWDQVIDINLKGVFLCMKYEIAQILQQEPLVQEDSLRSGIKGSIVNASSIAGKVPVPQWSAYCASKFGVNSLTQSVAKEYAETGIRINAVCPGFTETPMTDYITSNPQLLAFFKNAMHSKRFATSKEIADSIYFLGSLTVPFIQGTCLSVDGGGIKA